MKLIRLAVLLCGVAFAAVSCKDDNSEKILSYGTVSGVVTDDDGAPIGGATISVSDVAQSVQTDADGSYSISEISNERHSVVAVKDGYVTSSKTIRAASFVDGKVEGLDLSLLRANTRISGTVLDSRNGNVPLAGVVVTAGAASATTDQSGNFQFEKLGLADYALTFTYAAYPVVTINVAKAAFVDEVYSTGQVYIGGGDLLKTLDRYELAEAGLLIYDDYRAGNADLSGVFGDWSTAYMSAVISKYGNVEYQREGLALRPSEPNGGGSFAGTWDGKNERDDVTIPEDLNEFKCFIYGRKTINATNSKLSVRVRCHQAPSTFGVQVIDLSVPSPVVDKVGTFTHPNDSYAYYNADLSKYIGKEVIVVVGQYRDFANGVDTRYWHQLPVARLSFSDAYLTGDQVWFAGTEVIDGWKLTRQQMVNAGVQTLSYFTGMSPDGAGNDHRGISMWYGTNHIGAHWALTAINKDLEPVTGSGFIMKTRGDEKVVNTLIPESFIWAKFPIAAGANKVVLTARTMDAYSLFFKFAAFDETGTLLKYIAPQAGAAGSAGPDGTWKFINNTSEYSKFEFDLSEYNGRTITVALGVIKGEANNSENKIAIQSIELQ